MDDYIRVLLEIAESRYKSEFERRRHYFTVLSIYIGGMTFILGFLLNYMRNINLMWAGFGLGTLITCCLLAIFVVVSVVLYHLFRFIKGKRKIGYIASPKEIIDFVTRLKESIQDCNRESVNKRIKSDLEDGILKSYADSVDENYKENDDKARRLRIIGMCLVGIYTLTLLVIIVDSV